MHSRLQLGCVGKSCISYLVCRILWFCGLQQSCSVAGENWKLSRGIFPGGRGWKQDTPSQEPPFLMRSLPEMSSWTDMDLSCMMIRRWSPIQTPDKKVRGEEPGETKVSSQGRCGVPSGLCSLWEGSSSGPFPLGTPFLLLFA